MPESKPDAHSQAARTPGERALKPRSGARVLVDALRVHGADRIFCVPGESYIDVLDALVDTPEIQLVVAKHEGAAANMAEADGKLTGRPGICFVTRGPGATHASVGVHTAFQDSTPMILFVAQVKRSFREREAFQEIEFRQMFAPMAKWATEMTMPRASPNVFCARSQDATSGRPGPVVISIPEDVFPISSRWAIPRVITPCRLPPTVADLDAFRAETARSQRPLVILGGSGWTEALVTDVRSFVEKNSLPVIASFRRQDLIDNDRPAMPAT